VGATEANLIVTIDKKEPYFYLGARPVTTERLQSELAAEAAKNPEIRLFIRADTDAPFGQIVKVMDMANAAKIKMASAFCKTPGQP
jgi:biopolymer transport protein TolR